MGILTIQNDTLTGWVSLFRKTTAVLTLVMQVEVSCLHQTKFVHVEEILIGWNKVLMYENGIGSRAGSGDRKCPL